MNTIKHGNLSWMDIKNPKEQDIKKLKELFNFHPLIFEELTSPSQRPRAEEFDNCLYIVIHVPLFDRKNRITYSGELDIVITENYLITTHMGENIPLKSVMRLFNNNSLVKEKAMSKSVGYLLYFILEKLISSCFPKIDHISEKIDVIEGGIFNGKEKEMMTV